MFFFCIDAYSLLWKIEIFRDKDYFIFRRFIKQHKIYYRDCESYKFNSPYNRSFNEDSITIKTNTKKIRVEAILINSEAISLMLKKYNVPKVRDDLQSCIVVKMRKIHTAIITIATLCSFGVFVLCCFSDSSDIFVILFFAAFVLFSVIATLYYLLFRVEIIKGKDYFVYRAPFVKKTKIYYKDCRRYSKGSEFLLLKTNSKNLYIGITADNFDLFVDDLNKHRIPRARR